MYEAASRKFLPKEIKVLFIAESPPYYKEGKDPQYFYFEKLVKAELLFYTLIKAIYDVDFSKSMHSKEEYLNKLKEDGYFLMDAVNYPINKDDNGKNINNNKREKIMYSNLSIFEKNYNLLKSEGYINSRTKIIIIKKTTFNTLYRLLKANVIHNSYVPFPSYIRDTKVVQKISELLEFIKL